MPPPAPLPQELELLMEDLGTSVLSLPRMPPPQNFELLMEDSDDNNSAAANTNSNFAHLLYKFLQ